MSERRGADTSLGRGGEERECAHKDRESTNKIEMVSFEDNAKEREKRDRDKEQIGVQT
jgi:hypothetical protein